MVHPPRQLAGRLFVLIGGRRALGQLAAPSSSSAFAAPGWSGTGFVWRAMSRLMPSAALLALTRSPLWSNSALVSTQAVFPSISSLTRSTLGTTTVGTSAGVWYVLDGITPRS